MTRTLFSTASTLMLLMSIPTTSSASDLTKFLRSLSAASVQHHYHENLHRHHHDPHGRVAPIQEVAHHHGHERIRTIDRYRSQRRPSYVPTRHPGLSFRVSFGNQTLPPVPAVPAAPPAPVVPRPSRHHVPHLPHQIGEIVTCPVVLERCVQIRDPDEIAPNAVPIVVAVRDPHLGRYGCRGCVERVVYVQVYAPPCPVQRIRVSPCRTKVRLDFGCHEIDITSCRDVIEIDYDD